MKRIVLFLATNLAIALALSVSMRLLGVEATHNAEGPKLTSLLVLAAAMAFGGSLISLPLSRWMARKSLASEVIGRPRTASATRLLPTVGRQARAATIAALKRLASRQPLADKLAAFGVSGASGLKRLSITHPPLAARIAALKASAER